MKMKQRFHNTLSMLLAKHYEPSNQERVRAEAESMLGDMAIERIRQYATDVLPESYEVLRQIRASLWLSDTEYEMLSEAYAEARFEDYRNMLANIAAVNSLLHKKIRSKTDKGEEHQVYRKATFKIFDSTLSPQNPVERI